MLFFNKTYLMFSAKFIKIVICNTGDQELDVYNWNNYLTDKMNGKEFIWYGLTTNPHIYFDCEMIDRTPWRSRRIDDHILRLDYRNESSFQIVANKLNDCARECGEIINNGIDLIIFDRSINMMTWSTQYMYQMNKVMSANGTIYVSFKPDFDHNYNVIENNDGLHALTKKQTGSYFDRYIKYKTKYLKLCANKIISHSQ